MYYDNKSTFYVKQYGPTVLIIVISVLLIFSGVYAYISSTKANTKQNELVAKTEKQVDNSSMVNSNVDSNSLKNTEQVTQTNTNTNTDTKQDAPENIEISKTLDENLQSIKSFEKLIAGRVIKVNENKELIISINGKYYEACLIGIDYSKSESNIIERINNDLKGKDVLVSFDRIKMQDEKIAVYLYLNNQLYNGLLLNQGLAIVKVEKTNTNLLDTLIDSQKYAKSNKIGIWKNN